MLILNFIFKVPKLHPHEDPPSAQRTFPRPRFLLRDLSTGWADQGPPEIRFVNGHFEPSELVIQAGTAFSIRVTNVSDAPIEFESFELHRERVVAPGETITVYFPALLAGSFKFFDDFHSEVPEGAIVAK